jgi:hypothetical protein
MARSRPEIPWPGIDAPLDVNIARTVEFRRWIFVCGRSIGRRHIGL